MSLKIRKTTLTVPIFVMGSLFYVLWLTANQFETDLKTSTVLIGVQALFSATVLVFAVRADGISFRVIYWFYATLFLGLAPIIQSLTGIWRFGIAESIIELTALTILAANICFFLAIISVSKKDSLLKSPPLRWFIKGVFCASQSWSCFLSRCWSQRPLFPRFLVCT